jgi:DNA processing protein
LRAPASTGRGAGAGATLDAAADAAVANRSLLAALGHDPVEPDMLLASLGLSPALLSSQLLALELAGMVERLPGGRVQRVVK